MPPLSPVSSVSARLRARASGPRRAGTDRALPHSRLSAALLALSLGGLGLSACGWVEGNDSAEKAVGLDRIDRLVELCTPLDLTLTSNFHDQQLKDQRALVAELKLENPAFGRKVLETYHRHSAPEEPVILRVRLLEVAAHAAPDDTEPLLVRYITEYGHPMDVRTESVRLLAETKPQRALEVLAPYVSRTRATETTPDDEFLIQGWVTACDAVGRSPVAELADFATNIYKQPRARYYAAEQLGKHPEPLGIKALEAILIESSGDGLLRRKAAQALRIALPAETACELFRQVADREAELSMLEFLASMIQELCE